MISVPRFESLERRNLFASMSISGTASGDVVDIYVSGSNTIGKLNGSVVQTIATSSLTSISVDVGSGDDFVTIDDAVAVPSTIAGGAGNDELDGASGRDLIGGGSGQDLISGSSNVDSLYGDADADTLNGGSNSDYLYPGTGDCDVDGGGGSSDIIDCSGLTGDTQFVYTSSILGYTPQARIQVTLDTVEKFLLGSGNDYIAFSYGYASGDWSVPITVGGGAGNDTILGGDGADSLDGGSSNDRIWGGSGNDSLLGGGGSDRLGGQVNLAGGLIGYDSGNDYFYANDGAVDTLDGSSGSDGGTYDAIDDVTSIP